MIFTCDKKFGILKSGFFFIAGIHRRCRTRSWCGCRTWKKGKIRDQIRVKVRFSRWKNLRTLCFCLELILCDRLSVHSTPSSNPFRRPVPEVANWWEWRRRARKRTDRPMRTFWWDRLRSTRDKYDQCRKSREKSIGARWSCSWCGRHSDSLQESENSCFFSDFLNTWDILKRF